MKIVRIVTFIALVLFASVDVQSQGTPAAKPTIIFIHGVWADGSCWADEIGALQGKGYNVLSVQNPLTSLADDVAATKRAIDQAEGDVILVGHSWGGFVITQAGNDPKVKGLVYIAAFAPDAGETVPVLAANAPGTELSKYIVNTSGFLYLSNEGVKKSFAQDLSPKLQGFIYATQKPASQSIFGDKSETPAWKNKPSWYIVTKNDKAINPELERFMAKRINATTTELESGHVVMISHPKEVLKVIEAAAASCRLTPAQSNVQPPVVSGNSHHGKPR